MSEGTDAPVKVLRVATRCADLDQFVETFARLYDQRTLFIASLTTRTPGSQGPFVVLLADGSRALRGTMEVLEAWATPGGPFRRPGVRIKFLQLDAESEDVVARLRRTKRATMPAPPPSMGPPSTPPPIPAGARAPSTITPPPIPALSVVAPASPPPPVSARTTTLGLPPLPPLPTRRADGTPPPRRATPPAGTVRIPDRLSPPARPAFEPVVPAAATPEPGPTASPPPPDPAPPAPEPPAAIAAAEPPAPTPAAEVSATPDPAPPVLPPEPAPRGKAVTDLPDFEDPTAVRPRGLEPPPAAPRLPAPPPDEPPEQFEDRTAVNSRGLEPPMPEQRAPGSSFVLPANPLTDLTDDALRGFVECSLYEETGNFSFDDLLARPATEDHDDYETPVPDFRPIGAGPRPMTEPIEDWQRMPSEPVPRAANPPPVAPTEPPVPLFVLPANPPPVPAYTPPPALAFSLPPARYGYDDVDDPKPASRHTLILAIVIALSAAAIVIALIVTRSPRKSVPPAEPAAVALDAGPRVAASTPRDAAPSTDAAVPVAVAVPVPDPVADEDPVPDKDPVPDEDPVPAPDPVAADPVAPPPSGPCRLAVTYAPPDATLRINGRTTGSSLAVDVPCGRIRVELSRPRYAPIEKVVNVASAADRLELELKRPEHTLRIVSTPGGATATVDGRKVGVTPVSIRVTGFTSHRIEIARPGFRTFRTKMYSKKPSDVVAARLSKGK